MGSTNATKRRGPKLSSSPTTRHPSTVDNGPEPQGIPVKVTAPNTANVYQRGRLFRALDVARRTPIVWIMAPAGAGKTILVSSYLQKRKLPTLWYHVDAGDADAANLFHYFRIASRGEAGRTSTALPVFSPENGTGITAFARRFFEALCLQRPIPSAIVFDDYHEARSELWHEVVRAALSAVPRGVAVIIISRAAPPPTLARRVAAAEVSTIEWHDLKLTDAEVAGLVRQHGRALGNEGMPNWLQKLTTLASGWAAAVILLLEGARASDLSDLGLEDASQQLFDYFAAEILAKVEPAQREFLLTTSVTSHLTETVARHLTTATDARQMLHDLTRRSFLIQQIGDTGAYRYHPLLRAFLRQQAQAELGAPRVCELHARAASTLVEMGQVEAAIEELNAAGDVETRAALIAKVAPVCVADGRTQTLEAWITGLPPERVADEGWLSYWLGVCRLGQAPGRSRALFEQAYERFELCADTAGCYASCAVAMQATVLEGADFSHLDMWTERVALLERSGRPCPPPLESTVATGMILGLSSRRPGTEECRAWAERAELIALHADEPRERVMAGGMLAIYHGFFGTIGRAAVIVETLRHGARSEHSVGLAFITLHEADAICTWASGDNAASLRIVRDGLAASERAGIGVWRDHLCAIGAAAALGMDDCTAAREFLTPMEQTAQSGGNFAMGNYHFYASWEAFLQGDMARALRSAELSRELADVFGYPFAQALSGLALAQIFDRIGRKDDARRALDDAAGIARDMGSRLVLHACALIESDLCWEDDREHALTCLRRGLAIANEGDYCNMFWLPAKTMARLASRALDANIEPERVLSIIKRRRLAPDETAACLEGWPWRFKIRTLGTFEVLSESGAASLRGVPLRLLQAIVTFGGRNVAVTEIIDAIWPDSEGDAGGRVFDTTLHRLRRQLEVGADIRLEDGRVHLNPRAFWLDTWALEHVIDDVERWLRVTANDTDRLAHLSGKLLSLARGPLFATSASEDVWILNARKRIGRRIARVIESLGAALERLGRLADAVKLYERGTEIEPLAVGLYAGCMRCLAGLGQQAQSLAVYERLGRMLQEHGADLPGAELRMLYERLSNGRPTAP